MKIILGIMIVLVVGVAALWALETKRRAHDEILYPAPGSFLDIGDRSLHVECAGQSSGVTYMLEAGAGASSLDWEVVFHRLAERAQVCRYDRAGHGWSDRGPRPRTIEAIVRDLDDVIEQKAQSDTIVLLGHSFGGLIVQAYARKHPERIAGLVLVDAVDTEFIELYADQSKSGARTMRLGSVMSYVGIPRLLGLAPAPSSAPDHIQQAMKARVIRPITIATVADESTSVDANVDYLSKLPPINTSLPVTVLSRRTDPSVPFEQDWEAAQIRLAQLNERTQRVISTSPDHQLTFTDPDLVVEAAMAFENSAQGQQSPELDL
ncbi:MAG: alpha/beta hydrolase [Pseudomonadota bacterium]